ncbi:NmrA family NAD(P)-binding protein [Streptomyces sp. NPDC059255]|uniref:NmrA family NAD(P)-binding protein n=1 Tax=Streptomyces sp. NPDC059255 TaxID=3346793 RepID=UPI00369E3CED
MSTPPQTTQGLTLVTGGTGTTGRRVVERLTKSGTPVRVGTRSGQPPFSWDEPATWDAVLDGVDRAYIVHPVLMTPEAAEQIRAFSHAAAASGATRLVLLSGYGADEQVTPAEEAVKTAGAAWTLVRPSWFNQNFDAGNESMLGFRDDIRSGVFTRPVGRARFGFVDADDIADVVVAALTQDGHAGKSYDLTGPRLLSFGDVMEEISEATGRTITYAPMSAQEYRTQLIAQGVPEEEAEWMAAEPDHKDGDLADGVRQALERTPKDFAVYARETAATGIWDA